MKFKEFGCNEGKYHLSSSVNILVLRKIAHTATQNFSKSADSEHNENTLKTQI